MITIMTGIIFSVCPTDEEYHSVTLSLIGWVHTQNDPCYERADSV